MRRLLSLFPLALLLVLAAPAGARAASAHMTVEPSPVPGAQRLHFEYGPVHVAPGQNDIRIGENDLKPPEEGYIVSFRPNLTLTDRARTIPRVDQIHLHHGVWLTNAGGLHPLFAAGEEKTNVTAPAGYGWHFRPTDQWFMNHMIHNLTPTAANVYITYDMDFIPSTSPAAAGMRDVDTLWMDVMGGTAYPVFNALMGRHGGDRRYTYPDESHQPGYALNQQTIKQDGVLVFTAGHLHPGGLYTDLDLTRDGRTVRLFRSRAKYWEPAGAVSWDVAMTATPSGWRVGVRKGDVLSVHATYDTSRASWYESMGIMPVAYSAGGTGPDPFVTRVDRPGEITHGRLNENRNHGGQFTGLPDARTLLSNRLPASGVAIRDFTYRGGDLGLTGRRGRPPVVRAGHTLRFVNRDAASGIMHSITSCRAPCNRATGIAYPLANGRARFDSGTLGYGPAHFTAASNKIVWRTPKRLKPGTYTYFCRIHPFMRGAFRVRSG
jgi:plastocyanin